MGASPFVFVRLKKVAVSGCGKGNGARMLHNVKISLAAFLAMSACVALVSVADAAVQRFTDEAGVVIYTIDDDGSNASLRTRSLISPMVIHVAPPSALRYILVPPFSAMPAKTVPACDGSLKTAVAVPPRTATQLPPPSGDRQSAR